MRLFWKQNVITEGVLFHITELMNSSGSPLHIYQNVIFRYWVGKLVTAGVCDC